MTGEHGIGAVRHTRVFINDEYLLATKPKPVLRSMNAAKACRDELKKGTRNY